VATCRVCGSCSAAVAGSVEYIAGYAWEVHDCTVCGCRFTTHDAEIYNLLHTTGAISYYSEYQTLARRCASLFLRKDVDGLRQVLNTNSKYRFVIEAVAQEPLSSRILEVGCSRGYLASCFILQGRDVLGVDVSDEAVESARNLYGDHFAVVGDPVIEQRGPYDVIYHVGMIGCVADPVGLTSKLLELLRPGGKLIFNAPNRDSLHLRHQLWLDSAPPPDVVTLFPPGFFKRTFAALANVIEEVEMLLPEQASVVVLRQLLGTRWKKPHPKVIGSAGDGLAWRQPIGRIRRAFERAVSRAARNAGAAALIPFRSAEFGLFVSLVRS
jgi:2-polyprenyl-3-methyl-5-hydroxy-6-metoxy-1,4-benzoquinol methylase